MSPNDNIQFAGFKLMEDLCPFRSLCESVQHRNIDAKGIHAGLEVFIMLL